MISKYHKYVTREKKINKVREIHLLSIPQATVECVWMIAGLSSLPWPESH